MYSNLTLGKIPKWVQVLVAPASEAAHLPKWLVVQLFLGPDKEYIEKKVGYFRADTQDHAIEAAAHAIRRLALLKAYRVHS